MVWQIPDAVDTVVCAPNDGWKYSTKHVEQFPDTNKLYKVASCWIHTYIWILLGAHPILYISRTMVKGASVFWCVSFFAIRTWLYSLLGVLLFGLRGFLVGVASWAASCKIRIKLLVAVSTSSQFLSCILSSALSRTVVLYISHFVCEVCSRGAGCLVMTAVLMITITGVWSEVRL
jgi:hypothetical protein